MIENGKIVLNRNKKRTVRKTGLEQVNLYLSSYLSLHQIIKFYFVTKGKEMPEHMRFTVLDITILTQIKSIFLVHSWVGHFIIQTDRFALLCPVPLETQVP